jgi:Raf kinase inhibitor-like YbhB/YbcL family protein
MITGKRLFLAFLLLAVTEGGACMALELKSTAFKNGETIPARYTCEGDDVSPPLAWDDIPPGVASFALIADDPDAPMGTWVHWVIYDIPADARNLPEGMKKAKALPSGAKQGMTDFRDIGYGGPSPPPGPVHRYFFKLYALDVIQELEPGLTKDGLLKAMEGHVLAEAELMGTFRR